VRPYHGLAGNYRYMAAAMSALIPYDELTFVWVRSHYDVHLEGLCRLKGKLCRFATLNAFDDGEPPLVCAVYPLTMRERLWWLWRKKRFEVCVGYHWTYPRTKGFYIRRPRWLFQALFNLHYKGLRVRQWRWMA
jgi:hypothetical protein